MFFLDETFTNLLDSTPYLNNNAAANASIQSQLCSYRTTAIKNSQQVDTSTLMLTTPGSSYTLKPPILSPATLMMYQAAPSAITNLGNLNTGGFQSNLTPTVSTIVEDISNNCIYVGGNFTYIGQTLVNGIAKWDRTLQKWFPLGTGFGGGGFSGGILSVNSIVLDIKKQLLYVGGFFTNGMYNIGSSTPTPNTSNFAVYNLITGIWSGLAAPLSATYNTNSSISSLKLDTSNNYLYASGTISNSSDGNASHVIRFITTTSTPLLDTSFFIPTFLIPQASAVFNTQIITSIELDISNNTLYVGGSFNVVNPINTVGVTPASTAVNVNNIFSYTFGNSTVTFMGTSAITNPYTNGINGVNGTNGIVNALKFNPITNNLYVGGSYTNANNVPNTSGVSVWNTSNKTWASLSIGLAGTVFCFSIDSTNNLLFVGGTIQSTGGKSCGGLSVWDMKNNIWITNSLLGINGAGGQTFRSLSFFPATNQLYMGLTTLLAQFQGSTLANSISVWNRNNTIKIYDPDGLPFYESCIYKDHPIIAYYNGSYII